MSRKRKRTPDMVLTWFCSHHFGIATGQSVRITDQTNVRTCVSGQNWKVYWNKHASHIPALNLPLFVPKGTLKTRSYSNRYPAPLSFLPHSFL
ncbi:hypothetical protein L218DRAFT_432945 [Marasmius fiardii PR-910]|nr:hypothetical protein L218DRAFT_432945 [Marasmius fiardii PR-910]